MNTYVFLPGPRSGSRRRARALTSAATACLVALALPACGDSSGDTESDGSTSSPSTSSETTAGPATGSTTEAETDSATSATTQTSDATQTSSGGMTTTTDAMTETGVETDTATTGTTGPDIPPCPHTPVDGEPGIGLEMVAGGFDRPVYVTGHPTMPDTLYVLEQKSGSIKILNPGDNMAPPSSFLTLSVNQSENEMGLLGFAFHPDFPEDPRVYVNYNPDASTTRISEFTLADPEDHTVADPNSERVLLSVDQPFGNHNGGMIDFGPDGYLYISFGDGGAANDPLNSGQSLDTLLGKILRIDVEPGNGGEYSIPDDNPFVGQPGAEPEIWAYGLRNVWRFAFDPETGVLYAGDVGQGEWEEVSIIEPGENYGWNEMEGFHCFQGICDDTAGPHELNADGLRAPIIDYPHDGPGSGKSITGGTIYRSCEVPAWDGVYFYADFVSDRVWTLRWDGANVTDNNLVFDPAPESNPSSFGTNAWGDVYVTFFGGFGGAVYRVVPQ